MLDDPIKYGLLALLALALVIAAFTDLKSRTIGNWLTGAVALGAPVFWWASGMSVWPDIAIQLGVGLVTFAVLAILFAIRAMGGGDVKLLTALALWIEPTFFLQLLVMMALVGGVLTIIFGAFYMVRGEREKLAIPYGVAISIAGLWVLSTHYMPGAAQAAVMAA